MKFCMITSFFGTRGDASLVRLAGALLQREHEVHIIYSGDANRLPDGIERHELQAGFGRIAPLYAQQTGRLGTYRNQILTLLDEHHFDVIHLYDVSMLGGVELIERIHERTEAVKLMSVNDHWLLCPLKRLWQFNSQPCETPDCVACTLAAGKMPQFWRMGDRIINSLNHLDALIFPSDHAQALHRERGIDLDQAMVLPPFLPDDWANGAANPFTNSAETPYFVMTGELLKEKGFHTVIPLMKQTPHAKLYIIGSGNYMNELHRLAADLPNVVFVGELDNAQKAELLADATAMIVPSLMQESVGDCVLEAFSLATPVLVRNRGALPEFVARSGGGMLFENSAELLDKMHLLLQKPHIANRMGTRAVQERRSYWSESNHVALYIDLIRSTQLRRDVEFA